MHNLAFHTRGNAVMGPNCASAKNRGQLRNGSGSLASFPRLGPSTHVALEVPCSPATHVEDNPRQRQSRGFPSPGPNCRRSLSPSFTPPVQGCRGTPVQGPHKSTAQLQLQRSLLRAQPPAKPCPFLHYQPPGFRLAHPSLSRLLIGRFSSRKMHRDSLLASLPARASRTDERAGPRTETPQEKGRAAQYSGEGGAGTATGQVIGQWGERRGADWLAGGSGPGRGLRRGGGGTGTSDGGGGRDERGRDPRGGVGLHQQQPQLLPGPEEICPGPHHRRVQGRAAGPVPLAGHPRPSSPARCERESVVMLEDCNSHPPQRLLAQVPARPLPAPQPMRPCRRGLGMWECTCPKCPVVAVGGVLGPLPAQPTLQGCWGGNDRKLPWEKGGRGSGWCISIKNCIVIVNILQGKMGEDGSPDGHCSAFMPRIHIRLNSPVDLSVS